MNSSSKLAVFVFSRLPRPPRSTRMDTLVPYTSLVQSQQPFVVIILCPRPARKGLGLARRDHRVERRVLDRAPLAPRQIGRAHVLTPVTNAHLVCCLLLE